MIFVLKRQTVLQNIADDKLVLNMIHPITKSCVTLLIDASRPLIYLGSYCIFDTGCAAF